MHILPFRTYNQRKTRSEITDPSDITSFFKRKYIYSYICIYGNNKIKYFLQPFLYTHAQEDDRSRPTSLTRRSDGADRPPDVPYFFWKKNPKKCATLGFEPCRIVSLDSPITRP